jgi:hypothetical protein
MTEQAGTSSTVTYRLPTSSKVMWVILYILFPAGLVLLAIMFVRDPPTLWKAL